MTIVAVVQARMGSSRFPAKVMQPIGGRAMIGLLLERLSRARTIDRVLLATSTNEENRGLVNYVKDLGYETYAGSEDDVLDRFFQAVGKLEDDDLVVRITGDCPLVDPDIVDEVLAAALSGEFDYVSNVDPPTFPDGLDVEVVKYSALAQTWQEAQKPAEREHVTLYTRQSEHFKKFNVTNPCNCSDSRWTVDTVEDLAVVRAIFAHFHPRVDFSWDEVMQLTLTKPEYFKANKNQKRNEGAKMGRGQKLWSRAKRIIPGGNMLLSKRAEMFLPEHWPAYFSKAKGCHVWDLDNNVYTDMSLMGIGTNTLGYGHPEVDAAVSEVVAAGNLSTLNCPEEVYLAEKLIEMHPFADMARFCRSGGEANAVAIRIARAASGRDTVAICGYHGWHDWYLAANLGDQQNLSGHLLPGLEPNGVPKSLSGSVVPFSYNRLDELESLIATHDIGVIKMEVSRSTAPDQGFLEGARRLADENGIVLVFDECTSGFRETFGGIHKKYGVKPDLAVFGKTLGNGYAITAVIGRREVMEAAQGTFISSTFWTERIGPSAALKALEVMEREKSWEVITSIGLKMRERWRELATRHGFELEISGLPALSTFSIKGNNMLAYKTLITQEMLAKGYLATNAFYACTAHTDERIDAYSEALDSAFALIGECENGRDPASLLKGPVAHAGFRRLN